MFKYYKIIGLIALALVWARFVLPLTVSCNYDEIVYGSLILTIIIAPIWFYLLYKAFKNIF